MRNYTMPPFMVPFIPTNHYDIATDLAGPPLVPADLINIALMGERQTRVAKKDRSKIKKSRKQKK